MIYTVGLDMSITCTGVVVLDGDSIQLPKTQAEIKTKPEDGDIERFSLITNKIEEIITEEVLDNPNTVIFAENMAFGAKGQITRLAELRGIVRYCLYQRYNKHVVFVSTTTLKKFAVGKQAGKGKGPVMVGCLKSWGFETQSDDIADAYVLARIARMYNDVKIQKKDNINEPKYRFECLDTIEKSLKKLKK